ncbi:hypothetical protein BHF71_09905 [Vulcanibacillus modesticaldus]|uniref:Uncharacterized protein n=1 Tax=Vulcanibacillus modesticaldus TaxID=337097 RepID=A0A1D2YTH3_9BACI|nr:hypothetical protein [Vulcanibacillus modesticaldus]OEF98994.1 hypothetical protein BHF71_09905 [Vulcanibacillus modesticaldus]
MGHAIDFKISKMVMYFSYLLIFFFIAAAIFDKLIIPFVLFSLIGAKIYIKSELNAEYYKRILIKRHIVDVFRFYNDNRDVSTLLKKIEKKDKETTYKIYENGILFYFIGPIMVIVIGILY